MYRKSMLVVLVCILALGFSGFSVVEGKSSKKTFTWNRKERQIFTVSGERWVIEHDEFDEFAKEIQKVLPRVNCWGTSRSLLYLVKEKKRLETIKSCHTIFMVRPEYLHHLEELEAEYPDLLPVSTEKLKSFLKTYGYPLLYFSRDRRRKIRGVIIAEEVTPSLARVLTEKPIPLDTLLGYENGKLEKAKKGKKKEEEKEKTFTWNYKKRLIVTFTGRPFTAGFEEFAEEMQKVYGRKANVWGSGSLLDYAKNKERIKVIRSNNTIFTVRPENLYDLEDLEAKHSDLLPVSTEKLKSFLKTYGYPLLYFSRDRRRKIRGVIIAEEVTPSLARVLTEKPIPLDTLLGYENGKLEKAKKGKKKEEEKEKSFTWNYQERMIITVTARPRVDNYDEFAREMRKVFGRRLNRWGAPSLLTFAKKKEEIQTIKSCHTIFMVRPENLSDFENLEAKYPDLLPVSTEKLKSFLKIYGYPLLYFSRDRRRKIRGVIIADEVSVSLAKLLTEKPIPLNTLLQYENGELKKAEKKKLENEVRGGKPQKKAEEKPAESDQEKSLWEKKWSQKPAPEYTKHRVDDPEKYNVQGLRVNADFKVDLGEWWSNVELGTYWVPAAMLGTPDTTKEELLELKGQPEKAKREIDVLFEALAYAHLCLEPATGNVKTQGKQGIRWGFPMPAKLAIREEKANCAAMANIICYLLEDDYDEVGFFWRHSSFDGKHVGGHCTSYIKENGEYYFFDAASLTEERSHYPVEDGDGHFYHADMCDLIIQSTPKKYAIFWAQVSRDDEAIFAMFSSPDNSHFALGRKGHNLYYPKAFDESNLKIWKDPEDSVELLEASYNPTPPENYADYMPYKNYGKLDKTEKQGEPEIATIPSDG